MATLNFTIGQPTLLANQGFKIEYREQGDIVWIFHSIETDNSVSIPGLNEDTCYEIRITFLQSISPLIECPSVIETRCIGDELPCATVEIGSENTDGQYFIVLNLTLPSPYSDPCGGWKIVHGENSGVKSNVFYSTLIGVSPIKIPKTYNGAPYYAAIYAIDCDGNETLCDTDIYDPPSVPCTPAVLNSVTINYSGGATTITLNITPSNPTTNIYTVNYQQSNQVATGINDPGGTKYFNATGSNPEIFIFNVQPNLTNPAGRITYVGAVIDGCGKTHPFDKGIVI